ncbi:hypothetical protein DSECCO2_551000 [anaerobic digester metagenome]
MMLFEICNRIIQADNTLIHFGHLKSQRVLFLFGLGYVILNLSALFRILCIFKFIIERLKFFINTVQLRLQLIPVFFCFADFRPDVACAHRQQFFSIISSRTRCFENGFAPDLHLLQFICIRS